MDTVTVKRLQFRAKHGYYERERQEGNRFEVDLEFNLNLSAAADSDDLSKTVDYQEAERIVREIMHGPSVHLIETLTRRIGQKLFVSFPSVRNLEVRVRKMNPPLKTQTEYSEVVMKWQR